MGSSAQHNYGGQRTRRTQLMHKPCSQTGQNRTFVCLTMRANPHGGQTKQNFRVYHRDLDLDRGCTHHGDACRSHWPLPPHPFDARTAQRARVLPASLHFTRMIRPASYSSPHALRRQNQVATDSLSVTILQVQRGGFRSFFARMRQ